jgi:hypothetical protein
MPELNAEKINWEQKSRPESSQEPAKEILQENNLEKIESGNIESEREVETVTRPDQKAVSLHQEKNAETQEMERQLSMLLKETDPSEESGERQINNLVKKMAENLILKNDSSPSRTSEEKDALIDRLSEGNLSTYGYLQEIFNEEIGSKLDRKSF